jgi:hypothetical protein
MAGFEVITEGTGFKAEFIVRKAERTPYRTVKAFCWAEG